MINVILVLFIIVIFAFALRNSIKHFKGEGSCCGGHSGTLVEKKTVFTAGMKCSECAKKLWNSLNKIEELSVKKVNFKNGTAVLEASRNISDEEIKSAVENAGYKFIKTIP